MSYLRHNIHTSCDVQTTDSEKNISILMGKLRENGWKSSKTQGELRENDVENSVRTLLSNFSLELWCVQPWRNIAGNYIVTWLSSLYLSHLSRNESKRHVKLMGENSSFIFACSVTVTVPVYDFKSVWVVLHPSVKEFVKTIN